MNDRGILRFFEDGHVYELDGERIPCVSDLLRFLHREIYADAPVWAMEAAAERGKRVHQAAEDLDRSGRAEVNEDYLGYASAYAEFIRQHPHAWEMIETPIFHPELRYAGTVDRFGALDGRAALVDIKTTYTVYLPLCAAQLNLYRLALEAQGVTVQEMYILHLKKDGRYALIRIPRDDAVAMALVTLHNALRRRAKKGRRTSNGRNRTQGSTRSGGPGGVPGDAKGSPGGADGNGAPKPETPNAHHVE